MEKRTMVVIGALILLAAIPIGVLAFTATDTAPACCGQVQVCDTCAGCGPDGACDTNDCTCPNSSDCRPLGSCGAAAGCGC